METGELHPEERKPWSEEQTAWEYFLEALFSVAPFDIGRFA